MKILCLGYPLGVDGVQSFIDINEHNPSLYDFDAVIIYQHKIITGNFISNWKTTVDPNLNTFDFNIKRLKKESKELLKRGGHIICIVTAANWITNGLSGPHNRTISNYDWVPLLHDLDKFVSCVKQGNGTEKTISQESSFSPYLKLKEIRYHAYFDRLGNLTVDNTEEKRDDTRTYTIVTVGGKSVDMKSLPVQAQVQILAYNNIKKPIAFSVNVGKGSIVFLPVLEHNKIGEILVQCLVHFAGKKIERPVPTWISNYVIPGEKDIRKSLEESELKISQAQKEKDKAQKKLSAIISLNKLLYEQNDVLEDAVKDAFIELGFEMKKKDDKDWIAKVDDQEAILEVTGTEGHIEITKMRQLLNYVSSEEYLNGTHYKPILVGNDHIDIPPSQRKDPFTAKVMAESTVHEICLLTTSELFFVMCKLKEGKTDAKTIRTKILSTTGICKLSSE